jgi:hypothetical protein
MYIQGSSSGGYSIGGFGFGNNLTSDLAKANERYGPDPFIDQIKKMKNMLKKCD